MFASRASVDSLAPRVPATQLPFGATLLHEFWLDREARTHASVVFSHARAVATMAHSRCRHSSQVWQIVTGLQTAREFAQNL